MRAGGLSWTELTAFSSPPSLPSLPFSSPSAATVLVTVLPLPRSSPTPLLPLPSSHPDATTPLPPAPAYLPLLPPDTPPTADLHEFLTALARRLCMLKRGGVPDVDRAAVWFIKWWRDAGELASAAAPSLPASDSIDASADAASVRRGWGFDLEWEVPAADARADRYDAAAIQARMEACIDTFEAAALDEEREGGGVSATQEKKRAKEQMKARQQARARARMAGARRG